MSTAPLPASPAPSPTLDKQHISLPSLCTDKERLAAGAVAPKSATAADHSLLTPRLEAILASYSSDGHGDAELLKLLLQAKAKEDERLAALDALRAEQLRAANTVAMYSYYAQMSQVAALQQQQQRQRSPSAMLPAGMVKAMQQPYQPLSPPCESSHSAFGGPSAPSSVTSGKRSRQSSESADDSAAMSAPFSRASTKKARTATSAASPTAFEQGEHSASPPASTQAAGRVSRADVMAALRRKCEANQQAKQQAAAAGRPGAPRAIAPKPSASSSRASSVASNDASSTAEAAAQSMAAPRQRRRSSPQQGTPVGRHTAFLRTAAAPEDAPALPIALAPAPAATPAAEPVSPVEKVEPPVTAPRNKLALLLHASESSAVQMSPNWHPSAIAAMSDVRGSSQVA